jgi:hypothetical protein
MTWFKVDDTFAFHEKCVAAGNPAVGLWVRAGSWCAAQLNDGFVPDHMIGTLGTKGQAARLVAVNLWRREDGGYRFHQWNEDGRQPTREEVESKRQEWREKKRGQRRNSAGQYEMSPAVSLGDTPGDSRESPTVPSRPVPSRPLTTSVQGGSHVSSGTASPPLPRFPDHCTEHANNPTPGKCGDCADTRKARAATADTLPNYRLRVVPPLCGHCDERWIETPDGLTKCPNCYPQEMTA